MAKRRHFHAHETARQKALEGLPLASFGQRVLGYFVDLVVAVVLWAPLEFAWKHYVLHQNDIDLKWDFHEAGNLLIMLLYFGLANYFGNGRTVGKWVARTRAVSLTHERMTLWQSIERGLGYGAAILEGSLGFWQFFWDKNRQCAQDRLAETIVVDVRIRD
jgi:RDD family